MTRTITAELFGTPYSLRATWSDAASTIEFYRDGEWIATGRQVADYSHSTEAAMRDHLTEIIHEGGDDPADYADDLDDAIQSMRA